MERRTKQRFLLSSAFLLLGKVYFRFHDNLIFIVGTVLPTLCANFISKLITDSYQSTKRLDLKFTVIDINQSNALD